MNKIDRLNVIEQDLEQYNEIELAIDHFVQARKISLDVNSLQERKISLVAINAGWPYHASKQKIAQARSSNTNQARRHQCTPRKDPSRMYTRTCVCGYVSNIQQARKYSQRRCNASNHYTLWLTVYL